MDSIDCQNKFQKTLTVLLSLKSKFHQGTTNVLSVVQYGKWSNISLPFAKLGDRLNILASVCDIANRQMPSPILYDNELTCR